MFYIWFDCIVVVCFQLVIRQFLLSLVSDSFIIFRVALPAVVGHILLRFTRCQRNTPEKKNKENYITLNTNWLCGQNKHDRKPSAYHIM